MKNKRLERRRMKRRMAFLMMKWMIGTYIQRETDGQTHTNRQTKGRQAHRQTDKQQ